VGKVSFECEVEHRDGVMHSESDDDDDELARRYDDSDRD